MDSRLVFLTEQVHDMNSGSTQTTTDNKIAINLPLVSTVALIYFEKQLSDDNSLYCAMASTKLLLLTLGNKLNLFGICL
jgi:hypothetical protein